MDHNRPIAPSSWTTGAYFDSIINLNLNLIYQLLSLPSQLLQTISDSYYVFGPVGMVARNPSQLHNTQA